MSVFEFPPISEKQWKQLIQVDLKGLEYNKTLVWKCNEINVAPFYTNGNFKSKNIESKIITDQNTIGHDIISAYANNGYWHSTKQEDFDKLKVGIKNGDSLVIDTTTYEDNGATILQQLAYTTSILDQYLIEMKNTSIKNYTVVFNINNNIFFEIAKLKATLTLFQKIITEHNINLTNVSLKIKLKNSSKFSSNKNKLQRAILTKYTANLGDENSYFISSISEILEKKAYQIHLLIKNNKGFIKQLENGTIQRKIKSSATKDKYTPNFIKNIKKTKFYTLPKIKRTVLGTENNIDLNKTLKLPKLRITQNSDNRYSAAGFPPYLRGNSSLMYTQKKWKNIKEFPIDSIVIVEDEQINTENKLSKLLLNGARHVNNCNTKLIFSFTIKNNHFEEIAKLRAIRVLWTKILKHKNKDYTKLNIQTHCKIEGKTTEEKTIHCLSAIFGGTQTITTDPQIHEYLTQNPYLHKVIDPWGGNEIIENITKNLIEQVWALIFNKL